MGLHSLPYFFWGVDPVIYWSSVSRAEYMNLILIRLIGMVMNSYTRTSLYFIGQQMFIMIMSKRHINPEVMHR